MPKHLWSSAEDGQRERLIDDPWQERLESHLGERDFIASEEVYETLGVPTAQRNPSVSQRIAGILTGLGFERTRRRTDGGRIWGYQRVT